MIHLFFGEIVLRTKKSIAYPVLAKNILGNWGRNLIMISVVIGVTEALLAYLILGGEFLKILGNGYDLDTMI